MATKRRKRTLKKRSTGPTKASASSKEDLKRFEFHRHAMALLPAEEDKKPGIAFLILGQGRNGLEQRFCTCSSSSTHTCQHIKNIVKILNYFDKKYKTRSIEDAFRASIWYQLAQHMADGCRETPQSVQVQIAEHGPKKFITVSDTHQEEMMSYISGSDSGTRFAQRCGNPPRNQDLAYRGGILQRLARLTITENERLMHEQGFKTRGQALEQNFWYKVAYHGFLEFESDRCSFHPTIDDETGNFGVTFRGMGGDPISRIRVPRNKVKRILEALKQFASGTNGLGINPYPAEPICKATMNSAGDITLELLIRLAGENGDEKLVAGIDLQRHRYGDLVYLKELGILADLQPWEGELAKQLQAQKTIRIPKSEVPVFMARFGEELERKPHILDKSVRNLKILKSYDRVEITPEAVETDGFRLSVKYGFGKTQLSLTEILDAKHAGRRFIGTREGWVDCDADGLNGLEAVLGSVRESRGRPDGADGTLKLSQLDLMRVRAITPQPVEVTGEAERVALVTRLLEMRSAQTLPKISQMTSTLRKYQLHGTEWIWSLFEHGFGGLLCDDMGLGKTHQVMAFFVCLQENRLVTEPFLVVCPTTVLSHWSVKLAEHAPRLKTAIYYGGQRDLEETLDGNQVILTSYGILRRDIDKLRENPFALAVFDEVQYVKNRDTLAYGAAQELKAKMKLGLTGTPIENSLHELKALLDLTVPGLAGGEEAFEQRYIEPIEKNPGSPRKQELHRLISPFTMRRRKGTVLSELPEKIEDIRTCRLSREQIDLYREAVASRGQSLLEILHRDREPVPYMHIFALLNFLKQICNHPAMIKKDLDHFERFESGKWELFKELLTESLDSGQKVVVYSQFLAMIQIIGNYLSRERIQFVTLTGASRNRGDLIARFNNDPECRVYIGSLKAGGVGVDLVAASVVIHYDRWWNAAKEDQATDRVHRIGQKRGVHVFKLVSAGTLEEKISAIIQKKRDLMDSVVKEDDPKILKTFSREDLIEMLSVSALS